MTGTHKLCVSPGNTAPTVGCNKKAIKQVIAWLTEFMSMELFEINSLSIEYGSCCCAWRSAGNSLIIIEL